MTLHFEPWITDPWPTPPNYSGLAALGWLSSSCAFFRMLCGRHKIVRTWPHESKEIFYIARAASVPQSFFGFPICCYATPRHVAPHVVGIKLAQIYEEYHE